MIVTGSSAPPLNAVSIAASGGSFSIQFSGIPSQAYVIQSASAATGPWTDLSSPLTAGPTGLITYSVPGLLSSSQYFRVRVGP